MTTLLPLLLAQAGPTLVAFAVGDLIWLVIVLMVLGAVFGSPVFTTSASRPAGYGWGPPGGLLGLVVLLVILRFFGII